MARIVELNTYPVKGCAGTALTEALMTPAGLAHDRTFMVVDAEGDFRSQRRDRRMAVIRPEVDPDGSGLTLRAPDTEELRIPVDTEGPRRDVRLFGNPFHGIDQGDAAAEWFSAVLGAPCRLVRVPPEHDRVAGGLTPGTSGYADSNAVLVASRASLDELNRRIAETGGEPLPMNRFRANIVLDGWDVPHQEDLVRTLSLGGAHLGFAKLAVRCVVTTVDQESGRKTGPEPLRALAGYRRVEQGVAFGAKFSVLRTGTLAVGDEAVVGAWAEADPESAAPSRDGGGPAAPTASGGRPVSATRPASEARPVSAEPAVSRTGAAAEE
ncbi:MOSC domain-containing protein [Streptomyces palmae]|uniref:MOSC domain-containing protein n=1 Tax=Streptomyces palmae TaxID=1701085 RepID=A0A4Z0HA92_9ACTN|nr:MOSC domain-containing protein [Streptomyces palmae]